jgi:hypothetical protein
MRVLKEDRWQGESKGAGSAREGRPSVPDAWHGWGWVQKNMPPRRGCLVVEQFWA